MIVFFLVISFLLSKYIFIYVIVNELTSVNSLNEQLIFFKTGMSGSAVLILMSILSYNRAQKYLLANKCTASKSNS